MEGKTEKLDGERRENNKSLLAFPTNNFNHENTLILWLKHEQKICEWKWRNREVDGAGEEIIWMTFRTWIPSVLAASSFSQSFFTVAKAPGGMNFSRAKLFNSSTFASFVTLFALLLCFSSENPFLPRLVSLLLIIKSLAVIPRHKTREKLAFDFCEVELLSFWSELWLLE